MKVGYIRVSSVDQNLDRQLDGVELDRVYEEKVSGKDKPELKSCLDSLKDSDVLYVNQIHEVATNNRDLFNFLCKIKEKCSSVHFIECELILSVRDDLSLFKILSDFESKTVKERQALGRIKAKENGKQIGRLSLSDKKITEIKKRHLRGDKVKDISKALKIGGSTVYKYI